MKSRAFLGLLIVILCIGAWSVMRALRGPSRVAADVIKGGSMENVRPPISTEELRITDAQGRSRMVLSAKSGAPVVQLLQPNGKVGLNIALDEHDRGSIRIHNPDPKGPVVTIEVDPKGAHVKFDGPTGASSYLFLNNEQDSGVVFLDAQGKRRAEVLVVASGQSKIERFDDASHPIP